MKTVGKFLNAALTVFLVVLGVYGMVAGFLFLVWDHIPSWWGGPPTVIQAYGLALFVLGRLLWDDFIKRVESKSTVTLELDGTKIAIAMKRASEDA